MLTQDQINTYHEDGFILVEDVITQEQVARLREVTDELIEKSREETESGPIFDLEDGHSAEAPNLTRIKSPTKQHPLFWEVVKSSRFSEVLRQLMGPNVLLQSSKLNTKAPGGGAAVEWHQDWAFYPHTNDNLLACGLMLHDVDLENGPLQVVPGSHKGPVLNHHNKDGVFCGAVDPDDPEVDLSKAVTITGRAGSMTVHHVRALHGSAPNMSNRRRFMCFYECLAGDAWPLVGAGSYFQRMSQQEQWDDLQERIIIGEPTLTPRVETCPIRLPIPPAPVGGSIFKSQKSGGAKSAFAA